MINIKVYLGTIAVMAIASVALSLSAQCTTPKESRVDSYRKSHEQMCSAVRARLWSAEQLGEAGPLHPNFRTEVLIEALVDANGLDRLCIQVPATTIEARETMFQRGGPDPKTLIAGVRDLAAAMDQANRKNWPLP